MITRYIKSPFWYGVGDSIKGQVRKANEDNCGYQSTLNGELFVVCDGMGGHVGGATASRIAVDSIIAFLSQQEWPDKPKAIFEALCFANTQILGVASNDASLKGMGTTACVVLCDSQDVWIGHIGDSRIYLFEERGKYLHRISKDHSYVQALVEKGELDDRDAENHPQKNIITQALGIRDEIKPDVESKPLHVAIGDTLLICSDGLSGMVDDNEIEAILSSDLSLEDKADKLINDADAPGKGKDNITVQLIQALSSTTNKSTFPDFNPQWRIEAHLAPQKRKKRLIKIAILISTLLVLCVVGAICCYTYRKELKSYFKNLKIEWSGRKGDDMRDPGSGGGNDGYGATGSGVTNLGQGEIFEGETPAVNANGSKVAPTTEQIEKEANSHLNKISKYKSQIIGNENKASELAAMTKGQVTMLSTADLAATQNMLSRAKMHLAKVDSLYKVNDSLIKSSNDELKALRDTKVEKKISDAIVIIEECKNSNKNVSDKKEEINSYVSTISDSLRNLKNQRADDLLATINQLDNAINEINDQISQKSQSIDTTGLFSNDVEWAQKKLTEVSSAQTWVINQQTRCDSLQQKVVENIDELTKIGIAEKTSEAKRIKDKYPSINANIASAVAKLQGMVNRINENNAQQK